MIRKYTSIFLLVSLAVLAGCDRSLPTKNIPELNHKLESISELNYKLENILESNYKLENISELNHELKDMNVLNSQLRNISVLNYQSKNIAALKRQLEMEIIEKKEIADKKKESKQKKEQQGETKMNLDSELGGVCVVDTTEQIYSYEQMCADLQTLDLKYPDKLCINTIAVTKDKRDIYEVVIGNKDAEKHIIIQAGIHAREYMTTLLVMKQLEYYLAGMENSHYQNTAYHKLFDKAAVHILPMMNPDGITVSQSGLDGIQSEEIREDIKAWYERDKKNGVTTVSLANYLKRFKANCNGVDLNRNFDYGWDEFIGASKPGAEKYKGKKVGSEPEASGLVKLTKEIKPSAAISYHASGSVIYWDYGQTGNLRKECKELADRIHKVTDYEICYADTDKQDAAGYGDWAVMKEEIPSVTVEIGTGTAPLKIEEFSEIWNKNKNLWVELMAYLTQ